MNAIFLYLLKAALINALMLGFYHFAIRPGRNLKLMRAVLVLAIVLPLLLPLIPQPLFHRNSAAIPLVVFSLSETSTPVVMAPEESQSLIPLLQNSLYLGVTTILLLGLLISVISVIRKYLKTYRLSTPYGNVLIDNATNSPYSFFRWVFFSEEGLLHPAANWLLKHEFSHVKHGHSFDRLLSGLFRSFFWFSPFAHLNNRLLSEVHEYQADADAIKEFGDRSAYSNLIVSFAGLHDQQPLTNPFSAHLKKRMIMLNHLKPGKPQLVKIAGGTIIIAAFAIFSSMVIPGEPAIENLISGNEQHISGENPENTTSGLTAITIVSEGTTTEDDTIHPAEFPGGDEARIKFYQNNIRYPLEARNQNIQGTVQYKVFIETDGKVTSPEIISGIGGGCDEEVLRVAAAMPAWKPAMKDGKPVRTSVILPIKFTLSDEGSIKKEEQVFTVVENPPQFPGGEEARIAYMQKTISYPEQAKKGKIEGIVYVTFVIETDGQVSNAKVLRGIGGGCDEVALKAIQQMPPWIPGKQRGEAVRVQFNMPVSFKLGAKEKATAYTQPVTDINQEVFTVVEVAPHFPGGADAQQKFVIQNISYPAEAKSKGIQGTVYINFIVEKDGSVSNAKVLRGVATSLDTEALRVINSMPRWTPGTQRGEPVRVSFNIPIKFSLGEKNTGK
ncbi:MAG: TonB family protein [Lentimicrobium sp.]